MKEFVGTNDNHIRELVYQKIKMPITRRTREDDLPSVDKIALTEMLPRVPQLQDLISFNENDKLVKGWYGGGKTKTPSVQELLQPFPKNPSKALLHFIINPLGTKTGRRSSGGDFDEDKKVDARNSQNWPAIARAMIVSRWKGGKIGCVDYSSLEPIIQSWIARDELLFDIFYNGNGYFDIAKEIFGYTVTSKEDKIYKLTKNTYLGVAYLMGKWLMAQNFWNILGIRLSSDYKTHEAEVDKLRLKMLKTFKGLSHYQDKQRAFVARHQYVTSPSGRIRHLPHNGTGERGFKRIENQAVNFPVQSFASDITASAIMDYEEEVLHEHKLSYSDWHYALLNNPADPPCSVLFNEVHDEADADLHPSSGKRDLEILEDAVTNVRSIKALVPDFDIDLRHTIHVGRSWK
jgi:DNA polymerase I-like protein with 3'-5' exonuclease and polymerase domains